MASCTSSPPLPAAAAAADSDSSAGSKVSIAYEDGASIDEDGDALAVLLEEFALDEPCMAPLRLEPDRLHAIVRRWTTSLLHDAHLCVFARLVDEHVGDGRFDAVQLPSARGRIVGAAFNFHCDPGHKDDGDGWLGHFYPLPELRAHERFVIQLAERADICSLYGDRGTDASVAAVPAIGIGVLVCTRDQRGRGIAGGLVRQSLELAARRGYRLATATATSAFSQRSFERAGFERVLEASYAELPNASLYSDEHRRLHRSVVVYARHLLANDAAAGSKVDRPLPSI